MLVDFLHHEGFLKGDTNKKFAEEYDKYKQKLDTLNVSSFPKNHVYNLVIFWSQKKIKDFVLNGNIIAAIDLTKQVNASVLNDPKLLFKLYKQQVFFY